MSEITPADNKNFDHGYEVAVEELEEFMHNPGLEEMTDLFGAEPLPEDTGARIGVAEQVAADHWDFRRGAERQAVNWNDELLDQPDSEQWHTIFDAADKLGMVENGQLQNRTPDYLVILGGANKAPLDRLRFGLESVDDFGHVAYLGSSRPVGDAERAKAAAYAPDAKTEFDLGCGAFESLLGARVVADINEVRDGDTWRVRLYEFDRPVKDEDGEPVVDDQGEPVTEVKQGFVLSTPHMIGEERATTYDNYKFFARRAELAENPGTTIAAVTTAFYVPGQHLPAVQELTLPYDAVVETIGHSADYSGVTRKPSQLLMETKSGVDAVVRLQRAIDAKAAEAQAQAAQGEF